MIVSILRIHGSLSYKQDVYGEIIAVLPTFVKLLNIFCYFEILIVNVVRYWRVGRRNDEPRTIYFSPKLLAQAETN